MVVSLGKRKDQPNLAHQGPRGGRTPVLNTRPGPSRKGKKKPARGSHTVAPPAWLKAAETAALQRISLASEAEQDRLAAM
jgi:hypothetical protein